MAEQDFPFILTLRLDSASFERLDTLRKRHFPVERNFLSAHLTLFHTLPAGEAATIRRILLETVLATSPLPLVLAAPYFLGKGVAIRVDSEALLQVQASLAKSFFQWLTPQDRQGFRPHVTIQNKVTPDMARQLHRQLEIEWQHSVGSGLGLQLWRYLGGPWEAVDEFAFANKMPNGG